jgi:TRAP transporter TAXI family solute receptor
MKRLLMAISVAAAVAAAAPSADAETYRLTLCGGSVGGTWSLLGAGMDAALRKAYPGSALTIQSSIGGVANAKSLIDKKCEFGFMHAPEVKLALNGKDPFPTKFSNLRMVARLENWSPITFMLTKEMADKYHIKTVADIAKAKPPIRLVIQKRGNIAGMLTEAIFKEAGFTTDDIKKWGGKILYGASQEQGNLIQDRRADGGVNVLYPGTSSVTEVSKNVPITLVSIPDDIANRISKEWSVDKFTIAKSSYDFLDRDIPSVTLGAQVVTIAETPDNVVTAMLTAMVDDIGAVKEMHASFKKWMTPDLFPAAAGLPYHSAAKRFYESRHMQMKGE